MAATTTLGGAGLFAMTGGVSAHSDLTISEANAVATDDGQVNYVDVALDYEGHWDGFDQEVVYVARYDEIVVAPNSSNPQTFELFDGKTAS
jgi:hypothetical protein